MTGTVPASMRRRTCLPLLLACLAALPLTASASASAATFCVYGPTDCAGTVEPSLQAAIDAAAPDGGGTIRVGFSAPDAPGAQETVRIDPGNAVHIVGDVLDQLNLPAFVRVGGAAPGTPPVIVDEPGAEIEHLTLSDATTTSGPVAELRAGTLSGVEVQSSAMAGTATALHLVGGTVRAGSTIYGAGTALVADGASGTIEDSSVYGAHALDSSAGALTVARSAIEGDLTALRVTGGTLVSDDSFFGPWTWDGDPNPTATLVAVTPASSATVTLRSSTLDAFGISGGGLRATCAGATTADVRLLDSLAVRAVVRDVAASGAGCAVHSDHVQYGTRDTGGGATYDDVAAVAARPGDTTLLARDLWAEPAWDSPARDAGTARPAAAGETDVLGRPRVVDGTRDLGAIEYQHRAPVADLGGDTSAKVGVEADFDDGETYDLDHEGLRKRFTLDGMPVPTFDLGDDFDTTPQPPTGQTGGYMWWLPATTGSHEIGLTVTDPSGLSDTARRTIVVQPGPVTRPTVTVTVTQPPPTVIPPRPEVTPSNGPAMVVAIQHQKWLTARGRLQVQLSCRQSGGCRGVLYARMLPTSMNGKTVQIARLSYDLRGAQTKMYNMVLTRAGVKAIARSGGKGRRLSVVAYRRSGAKLLEFAGTNGTVRAPKRS